jgi:hypothetical protein
MTAGADIDGNSEHRTGRGMTQRDDRGSEQPQLPLWVDWLVAALIFLIGVAGVTGGLALLQFADRDRIAEMVADGTIQSDVWSGQDLVEVTFTTAQWSGVGLLAAGAVIVLVALGYVVHRRRAHRRVARDGGPPRGTWTNAIIGAVASVVLSFVPFSQALGGLVAGYLHNSGRNGNVRVGALSGFLAVVPVAFVLLFVFGGILAGAAETTESGTIPLFGVILGVVTLFTLLYALVLGALGGFVADALFDDE